ncbi:MAG: TraR/DksA family transcriptional regulator, partial [Actinomycetota bacterium]
MGDPEESPALLAEIRERLEAERASLERQLKDYGASSEGGFQVRVDEGFADSAQATAERSEILSLVDQHLALHREVVAALDRMDAGTYGVCERCGQPISPDRLQASPTAR